MGEVYRATDSVLERTVAVKLLSERHAREPEVRARFTRRSPLPGCPEPPT
jgi:serine/threonine protein kinase